MTNEDKAKAYAEQYEERYQVAMFKAFLDGATEQKEIDDTLMSEERQKAFKAGYDTAVDEACKWLKEHAKAYGEADGLDAVYLYDTDMLVRHFKKAMEE